MSEEGQVQILASLEADWKESVEELLFFNPQQAALEQKILETIHNFGLPRVRVRDERVVLEVGDNLEVGALFALARSGEDKELAGLLLFLRRENALLCLHLSVAENYTMRGDRAGLRIAARLLDEIRCIAKRIAGVEYVGIYYCREGWYTVPLNTRLL